MAQTKFLTMSEGDAIEQQTDKRFQEVPITIAPQKGVKRPRSPIEWDEEDLDSASATDQGPDLEGYMDAFDLTDPERIKLLRAYANYLAQKQRTKIMVKKRAECPVGEVGY